MRNMKQRIVLLGGGFVGTYTSRLLAQAHLPNTEIILISQTDHFLFSPLLIESLAGDILVKDCSRELRPWAQAHGIQFIQGTVSEIHRETKKIFYQDGKSGLKEELRYDDLVFAQGGSPNFFRAVGAKEYAYTLKTKKDLERIHARLENLLQEAQTTADDIKKRALLTVGVAGGGPAGVESVCSLRTYLRRLCRKKAPELLPLLSFFVIESSPDILPGFPEGMRTAAKAELTRQGIQLYTGEAVTEVRNGELSTPARTLPIGLLLWTAGIAPNSIPVTPAFDSTSPTGIPTLKDTLQIDKNHFIAGDVAMLEWNEKRVPKNGQLAMQLGAYLAQLIIAQKREKTPPTFHPEVKGFFLGMGDTGFLGIGSKVLRSKIVTTFRLYFYRLRMWQILS